MSIFNDMMQKAKDRQEIRAYRLRQMKKEAMPEAYGLPTREEQEELARERERKRRKEIEDSYRNSNRSTSSSEAYTHIDSSIQDDIKLSKVFDTAMKRQHIFKKYDYKSFKHFKAKLNEITNGSFINYVKSMDPQSDYECINYIVDNVLTSRYTNSIPVDKMQLKQVQLHVMNYIIARLFDGVKIGEFKDDINNECIKAKLRQLGYFSETHYTNFYKDCYILLKSYIDV